MRAYTWQAVDRYAPDMRRGKKGPGPWGPALDYWLEKRGWSQADLVRAIRKREQALRKQENEPPPAIGKKKKRKGPRQMQLNTVSRAYRGLHTNTSQLERMAKGLGVPFEEVLVSPAHRMGYEENRQRIEEAVRIALRLMDDQAHPDDPARSDEPLMERIDRHDQALRKRKGIGPKPPPKA